MSAAYRFISPIYSSNYLGAWKESDRQMFFRDIR